MKYLSAIILVLIFLLSMAWAFKVYSYFFEFTVADRIGLILSTLISSPFFLNIAKRAKNLRKWPFSVILLAFPLALFPVVSSLITITDWGWLFIYLFLITIAGGGIMLMGSKLITPAILGVVFVFFLPFEFNKDQLKFYDRLEVSKKTRKGDIQIVSWKNDYWVYYNNQLQFSTLDFHIYRESFVQPVMQLIDEKSRILLIGGDNRIVEDELSNLSVLVDLIILPFDYEFYDFMGNSEIIPHKSFREDHKEVIREDPFHHLQNHPNRYDLIMIDVPDPGSVEYSQYYSYEFYQLCHTSLKENGLVITQSGDLYKYNHQFTTIMNSIIKADFEVMPYHCQIPTIGQWSWIIGAKNMQLNEMKVRLRTVNQISETFWWDQDAMDMMLSFGKMEYFTANSGTINSIENPTILRTISNARL